MINLLARLSEIQDLPALPMVVGAVSRRVSDPGSGANEIARLLAHDQALTVRVLRLANSAFYAPKEPVRSVEHAVVMLGLGTVHSIILKASIFSAFALSRARPFWLHALGTACAARAIARRTGLARVDDAFVMGLLHDVGKLAMTEYLPDLYDPVRAHVALHGGLVRDAEQQLLGCDHALVGRFLCERWSMPAEVRDAIGGHHDVLLADDIHRPWAACVHIADIVARALLIGSGGDNAMPVIDPRAMKLLGLSDRVFPTLLSESEAELGKAEVFFSLVNVKE